MAAAPKAEVDLAPVLTSTSWQDRRWWSGALNRNSALDYFAGSPFYERTCLNEALKPATARVAASRSSTRVEAVSF